MLTYETTALAPRRGYDGVLAALARLGGVAAIGDLELAAGAPRSSLYRRLRVLEGRGYVAPADRGVWRLTRSGRAALPFDLETDE